MKLGGVTRPRATILIACLAAVCPATALAELRFCNHSDVKVDVVIAYAKKDAPGTTTNNDGGVTAEGWFLLQPGKCAKVSDIDVGNHWTYFNASGNGRVWAGSAMLCVPTSAFTRGVQFLHPGDTCRVGYRRMGFRRMDASTRGYTMNLNP